MRGLVQGVRKWSGVNVASLSYQISVVPTQENTPPSLRIFNLSPILSMKISFRQEVFKALSFLDLDPKASPQNIYL